MKPLLLALSLFMLAMTACAPVEDDIFTTARIVVATPDEGTAIVGVQAQARLTNINTRQVTTVATFDGNSVTVNLLRGAYQVDIEGVVACVDSNGNTRHRQFRCRTEYVEFVQRAANEITLTIIFLD